MRYSEFKSVLKEFAPPEAKNDALDDLNYLLQNAPVDGKILQKALSVLKQKARIAQTLPPAMQPKVAQPQQNANREIDKEPVSANVPVSEQAALNMQSEILKFAETASPQALAQIVYYIKLDTFKKMASDVIKSKIFVKAKAIEEQMHLAIGALANRVPVETMTDFLNECMSGGVIDTPAMISSKESYEIQPIPLSNEAYRPIIQRLLETGLGGASASGKGEFGLAFAGIDTTKSEHDISVGNTNVEVKASHGGTDFFFKGQKGFEGPSTKAGLKILISALNSAGANFKFSNEGGKGGITGINNKALKVLQPYFRNLGPEKTTETLIKTVQAIFSDNSTDISEFTGDIANAVDANSGEVNLMQLSVAMSKIAFSYYQQLEKHDGVLMLNIDNTSYSYHTSPDTFAEMVASGQVKVMYPIDFRTSTKGSLTFKLV